MTNEELAGALDQVRRLRMNIEDSADDLKWFLLRDLDKELGRLRKATRLALKAAAESQGTHKVGDLVGYTGVLHIVVGIVPKATLLYVLEKADADKKSTHGLPFVVANIVRHDLDSFKWNAKTRQWIGG